MVFMIWWRSCLRVWWSLNAASFWLKIRAIRVMVTVLDTVTAKGKTWVPYPARPLRQLPSADSGHLAWPEGRKRPTGRSSLYKRTYTRTSQRCVRPDIWSSRLVNQASVWQPRLQSLSDMSQLCPWNSGRDIHCQLDWTAQLRLPPRNSDENRHAKWGIGAETDWQRGYGPQSLLQSFDEHNHW